MRRLVAITGLGLAALVLISSGGCSRRHDVLLITIDTLRADRVHSYGYSLPTSPNLDALAAQGILFERAIAASGATTPSHASIMTSLYPRQNSVGYLNGSTLLEGDTTLAERFREAGYHTAAFVGNLVLHHRTRLDRGFDRYDDDFDRRELNRNVYERIAEHTTQRAIEWLRTAGRGPVFLWVHYQDPHGPYTPPEGFVGRFREEPAPEERPLAVLEEGAEVGGIPEYQALDGLFLPSQYRSRYADEIFYTDLWIGELLAAFYARPGEPVVLVTADHGESLGEHGRYFVHQSTSTPEIAHVPMILRAPGLAPERRSELVSHVDVMPTLLELAQIGVPSKARGVALGPVLRGAAPLPERFVYCDAGNELTAYRGQGFDRLLGTRGPWQIAGTPGAGDLPTSSIRYIWRDDGGWEPPRGDLEPPPPVLRYARSARPMTKAPALDQETLFRLRALGYIEP